eukprot:COSAG02_NODE_624_length_19387_cov_90.736002_2_plen_199_part_00
MFLRGWECAETVGGRRGGRFLGGGGLEARETKRGGGEGREKEEEDGRRIDAAVVATAGGLEGCPSLCGSLPPAVALLAPARRAGVGGLYLQSRSSSSSSSSGGGGGGGSGGGRQRQRRRRQQRRRRFLLTRLLDLLYSAEGVGEACWRQRRWTTQRFFVVVGGWRRRLSAPKQPANFGRRGSQLRPPSSPWRGARRRR